MNTKISITVNNDSIISKLLTLTWFIEIFRASRICVWLDTDPSLVKKAPLTLKSRKEPYEFEVQPGEHYLFFADPKSGSKKAGRAITGAFLGAAVSGAGGGSMTMGGIMGGSAAAGNSAGNGYAKCFLNEGDIFKISVKATRKGGVKVKLIQ